jgi:methylmalonyl-CoA/ethylmalonyl-CoA epimerase
MTKQGIAVAAAAVVMLAMPRAVRVQTPSSPFAGAQVKHVGLVIRDIDKAVVDYADFFGVAHQKVMESKGMQWPDSYTGDRSAWAKIGFFNLRGMLLDLVTPVGGASPWRNHLDRCGEGLQHLAIEVDDVDAAVADLIKRGGRHEMGAKGAVSQYVNMDDSLGITFEVMKAGVMARAGFDKGPTPVKFASGQVEHVSVVVPNAEKAGKLMADILGVSPPKAALRAPLAYPKEFDRKAAAKVVLFDTKPIGLAFVEPTGGKSPWRGQLEKCGPSIFEVALGVKDLREEIDYARSNGAEVIAGPTRGEAIVDVKSHPLPVVFELNQR